MLRRIFRSQTKHYLKDLQSVISLVSEKDNVIHCYNIICPLTDHREGKMVKLIYVAVYLQPRCPFKYFLISILLPPGNVIISTTELLKALFSSESMK